MCMYLIASSIYDLSYSSSLFLFSVYPQFLVYDYCRFLVLALISLLDWWMYGTWVLVPLNFLKFNFLSSGGDYYGTHVWHWYFTQGFTVMLFTFLPFSIIGVRKSKEWRLSGLIAWVLGVYSILGHKEFRCHCFLLWDWITILIKAVLFKMFSSNDEKDCYFRFVLPVLPITLMFSGYSLAAMSKLDVSAKREKHQLLTRCPSRLQLTVSFLLLTNIPMALYMSMVHQVRLMFYTVEVLSILVVLNLLLLCFSCAWYFIILTCEFVRQRGSEDVMYYLSKEAKDGKVKSILFLMPCHATPYYSTLHRNLPMRFLDCTPRWYCLVALNLTFLSLVMSFFSKYYCGSDLCSRCFPPFSSEGKGIIDESDRFLMDPFNFTSVMLNNSTLPSHIVLFDSEGRYLTGLLASHSFKEVWVAHLLEIIWLHFLRVPAYLWNIRKYAK